MNDFSRVEARHALPICINNPVGARYIVPDTNSDNIGRANCIRPIDNFVKMVVLPIYENRYR